MNSDEFRVGYIIGLIVSGGTFTGDRFRATLELKLHEDNPEPLTTIQEELGGAIYGPYNHDNRRYFLWRITGKQLYAVIPFLDKWLPVCHKRRQYEEWKLKWHLD
jgi:hypothetical protein